MNSLRRTFIERISGIGALVAASATGLFRSGHAWAARNDAGFESKAIAGALKSLGATNATESKDISITAPDIAENGAIVPVAVTSRIPNTEQISILAEKNPFPLAATFDLAAGSDSYVSTRLKMGQTCDIWAVVKAGGQFYVAKKEVKITVGGCG